MNLTLISTLFLTCGLLAQNNTYLLIALQAVEQNNDNPINQPKPPTPDHQTFSTK